MSVGNLRNSLARPQKEQFTYKKFMSKVKFLNRIFRIKIRDTTGSFLTNHSIMYQTLAEANLNNADKMVESTDDLTLTKEYILNDNNTHQETFTSEENFESGVET